MGYGCTMTATLHTPLPVPMAAQRLERLDALRGLAMLWMTAFHFCFDLNHFGLIQQQFLVDPFWTWQRTCIVSLFLLCAGLGQSVALVQGQAWGRFARRWLQIAGCAVLVSLGSWWVYPHSYISFGVLHGMAVMLVLVRLLAGGRVPLWLWAGLALGLAGVYPRLVVWGGWQAQVAWLNGTGWNALGLVTRLPVTQDYVPVLPWLGVMCAGAALGQWLQRVHPAVLGGALPAALRLVAALGRWSLSYYMLHQPVLMGALMLWTGRF